MLFETISDGGEYFSTKMLRYLHSELTCGSRGRVNQDFLALLYTCHVDQRPRCGIYWAGDSTYICKLKAVRYIDDRSLVSSWKHPHTPDGSHADSVPRLHHTAMFSYSGDHAGAIQAKIVFVQLA